MFARGARRREHRLAGAALLALAVPSLGAAPTAGDPSQPIRLYVLAGQSNAVGFKANANLLPPELQAPQTDVAFWYEEGVLNPAQRISSGGAFIDLQYQSDPTGTTFGGIANGFGPEISMGRVLADDAQEPIALVKFAINGTSLAFDWDPGRAGSLYFELLAEITAASNALVAIGKDPDLAGFFWMQGESDAANATWANEYGDRLEAFVHALRLDLGAPTLPFTLGRLNENIDMACCPPSPHVDIVRAAQVSTAGSVAGAALIDTDDLPLVSDLLHFSAAGQVSLGQRFAGSLLSRPVFYCAGKTNSLGCVPFLQAAGAPSASELQPFRILGQDIVPDTFGLLLYTIGGKAEIAFHGGTLCIKAPFERAYPLKSTVQLGGAPCTGVLKTNFNNRIASGNDPNLTIGQRVNAQWYYRDSLLGDGFNDGLTDAIRFVIDP